MLDIPLEYHLFEKHISQFFGRKGFLESKGFVFSQVQYDMAFEIADSICSRSGERFISFLQAETGIGKTLAYALNLAVLSVEFRQRSVLSTFTLSLQSQFIEGDWLLVQEYLESIDAVVPVVERLLGRQQFVSVERVAKYAVAYYGSIDKSPEDLVKFYRVAQNAEATGGLLVVDYVTKYGELPCGMRHEDVCFSVVHAEESELFVKQKELCARADIVVTSHAMVAAVSWSVSESSFLGGALPACIVFDEADKMVDVVESLVERHTRMNMVVGACERIAKEIGLSKGSLDDVVSSSGSLESHINSAFKGGKQLLVDVGQDKEIGGLLSGFTARLSHFLIKALNHKKSVLCQDDLAGLVSCRDALLEHSKRDCSELVFNWSPVRNFPSVVTVDLFKASIVRGGLKRLFKFAGTQSIFMSGTLSDVLAKDLVFNSFRSRMFISSSEVLKEVEFQPESFGRMSIKLCGDGNMRPFIKEDGEVSFSMDWLRYVERIIRRISDQNTLVLCGSYEEVRVLGGLLSDLGSVYAPSAKVPFSEQTGHFQANGGVFLSPRCWEGVNLRTIDGKQLIENLMITRIPYVMASEAVSLVRRRVAQEYCRGVSEVFSHLSMMESAAKKMQQGVGRGLRRYDDVIDVYILDSRFPVHDSSGVDRRFVNIFPKRFYSEWRRAELLHVGGNSKELVEEEDWIF